MKVVFRPAARRDILLQIAYFIDHHADDDAARFPRAVEDTVAFLAEHPDAGAPKGVSGFQILWIAMLACARL